MKCAECKQDPKNRCDKDGFDCTGGKLDMSEYGEQGNRPLHTLSGQFQHQYGNNLTRLEELIKFCLEMQYQKIGIAFCVGLAEEAGLLSKILEQHFKVDSVCCKMCGLDKKDYDVKNVKEGRFEALCNPLGQAKMLNKAKTDLNVELGLCVGHDILFHKYSEAPVSVFAVKDRVLAHNPLGAVYSSYWRKKYKI
ncbi:MAG: DUF1847 domain-containing protein [Bacillota bacterium]